MKRYIKIWRKPNGEMVTIPVRSRSGVVGELNSYGWELVYIGSLICDKKPLLSKVKLSDYFDVKELLNFGIKGAYILCLITWCSKNK